LAGVNVFQAKTRFRQELLTSHVKCCTLALSTEGSQLPTEGCSVTDWRVLSYRLKDAQLPTDSSDSAHNQLTQLTNP